MVRIRLMRMGTKHKPHFRIVVADARASRDGKFIDQIGFYDPTKQPEWIKIDKEKVLDWLRKGAQPTDTVRALLKREGIDPEEFRKAIRKKKKK